MVCPLDVWELLDRMMSIVLIVGVWGVSESLFPDKGSRWALLLSACLYFLAVGLPSHKRRFDHPDSEAGGFGSPSPG